MPSICTFFCFCNSSNSFINSAFVITLYLLCVWCFPLICIHNITKNSECQ
nr:MAG TPA: hypothetical protein [Bacteriophage sp.]